MIDYNRGVEIRRHSNSGAELYMYQDAPGVYLTAHGTEVSAELASAAGFRVDEHLKLKAKNDAMTAAERAINAQYAALEAKYETVKERKGYKLVDIGADRFCVMDPDGNNLTPKYMSKVIGENVFDQLVPPSAEDEAEPTD